MPAITEQDFAFPFADDQKAEGARLFREGQVQLVEGSADGSVEAKVAFFRRFHRVWLERKPQGGFESDCSCPHRENTGSGCAHVWAVVLALADRDKAAREAEAPPWIPLYGLVRAGARTELALGLFEAANPGGDVLRLVAADADRLARVAGEDDLAILRRLEPLAGGRRTLLEGGGFARPQGPWELPAEGRRELLLALSATGRFDVVERAGGPGPARGEDAAAAPWKRLGPVHVDDGAPFELALALELPPAGRPTLGGPSGPAEPASKRRLAAWIVRGVERLPLAAADAAAVDAAPLVVHGGRVLAVEAFGAQEWIRLALRGREILVPPADAPAFFTRLSASGPLPRISTGDIHHLVPCELGEPVARVEIRRDGAELWATLGFAYGGRDVPAESAAKLVLDLAGDRQWRRDAARERALAERLEALTGWERDAGALSRWFADRLRLDETLAALIDAGFVVVAEDARIRRAGTPAFQLRSGIDWFDLEGDVPFDGGGSASLEDAMNAWNQGRRFVVLDDGSRGLLPQDWMERLERLRALSPDPEGRLRFRRAQALLLEPLLGVAFRDASDRELATLRSNLQSVAEAGREPAPAGFAGTLRPYQEHGLAWLRALSHSGLGGCLADDMGLGKTVQALAMFLARKHQRGESDRSLALVVCPRSLLWNWRSEAARFAPSLALHEHHGGARATEPSAFASADLVLTTYGTLQRDIGWMAAIPWDLVLLDEAQAIKNPRSKNAEAARSLDARVRLSLTGTPIENSLRDLWSQMEFLNPGLLGPEQRFLETLGDREAGPARAVLAKALRPLILRRTKEEVVPELPPRTEQTLHCALSPEQEALYASLREDARRALEKGLVEEGLGRTRFHVLESLLRLRQAACHPGLVLPEAAGAASGKLDLLFDELAQVVGGGHKALVFSQFTTLLKIVARRFDEAGPRYAYLDGATRDRESVVRAFQTDPAIPVFLISLKAGGLGLNLTAADYVFILDPWWNPAVEAQAIDRTHRIGQTRAVFAYRLVSQGTVEERILELQAQKRELAEAILTGDSGPLGSLTEEDLRLLLS